VDFFKTESLPSKLVPEEDKKYLPGSDYCEQAGKGKK